MKKKPKTLWSLAKPASVILYHPDYGNVDVIPLKDLEAFLPTEEELEKIVDEHGYYDVELIAKAIYSRIRGKA